MVRVNKVWVVARGEFGVRIGFISIECHPQGATQCADRAGMPRHVPQHCGPPPEDGKVSLELGLVLGLGLGLEFRLGLKLRLGFKSWSLG